MPVRKDICVSIDRSHQRGAASLIVVMLLFFLMLLVAAYASRSLIFEQRTSANQYRYTQAFEAAEAGMEWGLAMLNSEQFINASCEPSTSDGSTFRERYLPVDSVAGKAKPATAGVQAACRSNGNGGWTCNCPTTDVDASTPATNGIGFIVGIKDPLAGASEVPLSLQVYGCAGIANNGICQSMSPSVESESYHHIYVARVNALRKPPTSALTVMGDVSLPSSATAVNTTVNNGIAIESTAAIVGMPRVVSAPGTPDSAAVVQNNVTLPTADAGAFLAAFAGINKAVYQRLPGVVTIDCSSNCAADLQTRVASGAQMFWLTGTPAVVGSVTLGTPTRPVLLVANGDLAFEASVQITGAVLANALSWPSAGAGSAFVTGATVVAGPCCAGIPAGSSPTFTYNAEVLELLRMTTGAYARVPGSWSDR